MTDLKATVPAGTLRLCAVWMVVAVISPESAGKIRANRGFLLMVTVVLFLFPSQAQVRISLQAAIDTALKNNPEIRNAQLISEYREKLIKTGNTIPNTMVTGEYGQINSAYADNKVGILQTISFPGVYARQRSLLRASVQEGILSQAVKEAELKRDVSRLFYDIVLLRQKKRLLLKSDSLFSVFLLRAKKKLSDDESNVLERITAESQQGQVMTQLLQVSQDLEVLELRFRLLLNCLAILVPQETELRMNLLPDTATVQPEQHSSLLFLAQQNRSSQLSLKVEKSKLLPDLFIAYNTMTMKGFGADEAFYTGASRFHSAQFGLSIPLFFGAQKARISSARWNNFISENNYKAGIQSFKAEYMSALSQYNAASKILAYYETDGLRNAGLIAETAEKQFLGGNINYFEYVLLTNQSALLESDYYNALRSYNESVIQINYLSSK